MPAAATRAKRPLATRTNDVDTLAVRLGTKLKIADANGIRARKPPVQSKTADEQKADAMRTVNSALQILSAAGEKSSGMRTPVSTALSSGRAALETLRKLDPRLLNAERAALTMASKLCSLNMYEDASSVLSDVRQHLPVYYDASETQRPQGMPVAILQLPIPSSNVEATVLALIPSFFNIGITIICQLAAEKSNVIDGFINVLETGSYALWSDHLSSLPSKTTDALYKRAYSVITSSSMASKASPLQALRLRFSALRVLLLSVELDTSSFWDQALKFAASYARKAETETEEARAKTLLSSFRHIEAAAGPRKEGKGWVAFCEYRMMLSKRVSSYSPFCFYADH